MIYAQRRGYVSIERLAMQLIQPQMIIQEPVTDTLSLILRAPSTGKRTRDHQMGTSQPSFKVRRHTSGAQIEPIRWSQ